MTGSIDFTPLAPEEALKFFRGKTVGGRISYAWQDMMREEHAAAFVVAKMMRADLLKDVHSALEEALNRGQTVQEFTKKLRPILEAKGWWGFGSVFDPVTGTENVAELGTPRRLATIYDVNLRSARAAGRWERIERQKATRPYLMYVHAGDGRVRAQHRRWGDKPIILPVDHPFWKTHYPPNGWRCRCIVRQVTAGYLKKNGLQISSEAALRSTGWGQTTPWTNPRTGKTRQVPRGLDPSFDYNVGQSRLGPLSPIGDGGPIGGGDPNMVQLRPGGGPLPFLPARPARSPVLSEDITAEAAVEAFLDAFEGPVFYDKAQVPLLISRRLFVRDDGTFKNDARIRKSHILVFADTIKDPDEIWAEIVNVGGTLRLKRRALARWQMGGPNATVLGVFEEQDNGVWRGATLFQAGAKTDDGQIAYALRRMRVGTLIYRREEN